MNLLGFTQPSYIPPFDRRGSFQSKMFGWTGALTSDRISEIAAIKRVIHDGFKAALESGVARARAGILVRHVLPIRRAPEEADGKPEGLHKERNP